MEFHELQQRALDVQRKYKELNATQGHKQWAAREYVEGLVGDVGDLMKLTMAREGIRGGENIDQKIKHELADCLWSLFVIASEMNIDLEKAYSETMEELIQRIDSERDAKQSSE